MRGFTLLEMIVVIGILAVASLVAAVAWQRPLPRAGTLVAELEAARTLAITTARPQRWSAGGHEVHFWPDGSSSGGVIEVEQLRVEVDALSGRARASR